MKKLTLIIAAVATCFVMASCGGTSPKETVMKATDDFFTQAEKGLNENVVDAESFMEYFYTMEEERDAFLQSILSSYTDDQGDIKGFTETEWNEVESYMYDRATAYNKKEGAKAAEFLEPIVAKYEAAVDALVDAVTTDQPLDDVIENFEEAETELAVFADYDNIPVELQKRVQAAEEKLEDILAAFTNE